MTGSTWRAATPAEQLLQAARAAGDVPGYLMGLVRTDLLVLVPEHDPAGWAVSDVGDRPCLVAFTSQEAMVAALGAVRAHRPMRFALLSACWPGPELQLAVDPGLPIEMFLEAAAVVEVAALADRPATALETRLARALEQADVEGYLALLAVGEVLLPLDVPLEAAGLAPGDGEPPVVVFTSAERLRERLGEWPYLRTPLADLVRDWPAGAPVLVDPGLPHSGLLQAAALSRFRSSAGDAPAGPARPGSG